MTNTHWSIVLHNNLSHPYWLSSLCAFFDQLIYKLTHSEVATSVLIFGRRPQLLPLEGSFFLSVFASFSAIYLGYTSEWSLKTFGRTEQSRIEFYSLWYLLQNRTKIFVCIQDARWATATRTLVNRDRGWLHSGNTSRSLMKHGFKPRVSWKICTTDELLQEKNLIPVLSEFKIDSVTWGLARERCDPKNSQSEIK